MTTRNALRSTALGATLIALLGACQGAAVRARAPSIHEVEPAAVTLTPDFTGAQQVGAGPHRYRFVLDDTHSGEPAGNRPYALSHRSTDLPFVASTKKVYQGVTDALGRTAVFAFAEAVPADGWVLRERFGSGEMGEQLVMTDPAHRALSGIDYELVICGDPPTIYRGTTDANGLAGYAATSTATKVKLRPAFATLLVGDEEPADPVAEAKAQLRDAVEWCAK
ncbi:MAG: hypothetical protein JF591_10745 [Lysobacter sp.]|nr:hypothetical protein [Lysobacter sp.]